MFRGRNAEKLVIQNVLTLTNETESLMSEFTADGSPWNSGPVLIQPIETYSNTQYNEAN